MKKIPTYKVPKESVVPIVDAQTKEGLVKVPADFIDTLRNENERLRKENNNLRKGLAPTKTNRPRSK